MPSARTLMPYESSGGASELRSYDGGEEAQIELHRKSFSVIWSSDLLAYDFMRLVSDLVSAPEAGKAKLSPSDGDAGEQSFTDAWAGIEDKSIDPDFIKLEFPLPDGELTWAAPERDESPEPSLPHARIGVIATRFGRPGWLSDFIKDSATTHVGADIEDILGTTQRLTSGSFPVV